MQFNTFPSLLLLLFALLSSLYITTTDAKLSRGIAHLDSTTTTEYLLGSFSFSSHLSGTINGTLTFPTGEGLSYYRNRNHNLVVSIYDDKAYKEYQRMISSGSLCRERIAKSTRNYRLAFPSRTSDKITFHHNVTQSANVLNSYAILSDCLLEDYPASPPPVHFEVTFLNGDEHLPQDERHMPTLLLCALIPLFISLGLYIRNMSKQHTRSSQVHLIQVLIGVAFICVVLSILAQLLHLYQYSNDGLGLKLRYTWFAMDFFSEITQVLSEIIIAFVFISIALFGWLFSTTSSKMTTILQRRHIPFFVGYILLHLYLQYQTRKNEADFNYFYYDLQHWAGFAIIMLRILSLLLFVLGVAISTSLISHILQKIPYLGKVLIDAKILTPTQIDAVADGEKIGFLSQSQDSQINTVFSHLTAIGLAWFSVLPIAITFSLVFNPSSRRLFVVAVSLSIHVATLIWFLFAFTFESLYYKASCLSNMGTVFSATQSTGYWSSKIAID